MTARTVSHRAAPRPRIVFARRAPAALRRNAGFTLIELIAAFVIFALGFGILMQILGGALHTTKQSAEYTQAALFAQSLLDVQGVGEPLEEGGRSGQFDERFSWQLNVSKYQPIPVTSNNSLLQPGPSPITAPGGMELFQLELVVNWGNQYLMHHARFVTLRAMGPARPGGVPAPLPGFGG